MAGSYGFLEISGTVAAVTALDIMCKTADVNFVTWERRLGGRLVTVVIQGTVSDVTIAIRAAVERGIKRPVATVVIANPHEEIVKKIRQSARQLQ